jgi:hypothetical protein
MPPDLPGPGNPRGGASKPAWKGAAVPGKPVARGPKYAWKPQEQAAVETNRWVRRVKLSSFVLGGIGCVALIVVLIYLLRAQKGACLVLVGADPAADVEKLDAPLDPYGWSGAIRLAEWSADATSDHSRRSKFTPKLRKEGLRTPESIRPADLPAFFEDLERRELNPLIVYLGLHGAVDASGPFLFTAGGERLYIRELIDGFAGPRLKDKHVVLLFDPSRMNPDPTVGVMHSDCVRGIKQLDEEGVFDKAPNLVVICANDAGERGWSAEEWGTSGFAQVLLRGLGGAAKPSSGVLITASDLFDYVHEQTDSWSRTRPTTMTPILLPKKDGVQRAKDMVLLAKVGDPDPWPEPTAFTAPDSLVKHWTTAKELEDGTPSPGVYTPKLWRRYRELLLRYGQMLRAGKEGDEAAKRLNGILDRTEQDLRDGRGLRFADGQAPKSRGNALPLPAALGLPNDPAATDAAFISVWREDEDARLDKAWETAVKNSTTPDLMRTRFYDFILQRVLDPAATRDDLDKAARVMARPWLGGTGTRPAEAHLLVMTRQFFSDPRSQMAGNAVEPATDLWKQAIATRRLAERAALGVNAPRAGGPRHPYRDNPYSEALWTQLEPKVIEADIVRRDGEDLLFASLDTVRTRSGKELDAAKMQYDLVLRQAKELQTAFAIRDEALADLPLLTRWVASLPARDGNFKPWTETAKVVWPKVHALARRLDGADRPTGRDQLTEEIEKAVSRLKQEYGDHCRKLADKDLQAQWEQIEQVTAVPPMLIEPALRKALLESGARQIKKQTEEWIKNPKLVAPPPAAKIEDIKADLRAQAVQQTELAVAILGDIPNEQLRDAKGTLLTAGGLRDGLASLSSTPIWQIQVNLIGEHIGRHWQVLSMGESGALATGGSESPPVANAPRSPTQSDLRSRWAVAFRPPPDGPEPATVNRLKRWQKLLVGLAMRTVRDHWYESEKKPKQYFVAAADLYLDDAKKAGVEGSAAVPGLAPVEALRTASELQLEPAFELPVRWTSENHRTLTFTVKAPKVGPGGYVTLWSNLGQSLALTLLADDQTRQPIALPATDAPPAAKRDLHIEAARLATDAAVSLAAHGYFRGQWLKSETEIKLNRTPETVVTHATTPNDAAVAVRAADDLDLGAIAIVLDFSGSMAEFPLKPGDLLGAEQKYVSGEFKPEQLKPELLKPGAKIEPGMKLANIIVKPGVKVEEGQHFVVADWTDSRSKNQQAVAVLEEVLRGLPSGTPISLRLFGHKYDEKLYNQLHGALPNKNNQNALDVIGTQATLSDVIYKGRVNWSRANVQPLKDQIIDKLKKIEPLYGTPLARTMVEAKDDYPEDYEGTRTLLVLTDGMDTTDPQNVRVAAVKNRLRAGFANANDSKQGGISIQMVLFRVDEDELKTALEQFKEEVEQKLKPPGRVRVAGETKDLKELIDFGLRPKLRLVDLNGVPAKGVAPGGLPANRPQDELTSLRWTGANIPQLYDGYVFNSRQKFFLQRGDRMLVSLFKDSTGVRFERGLLVDELPQDRVAKGDDWYLGLPRYHSEPTLQDKQLWATATLETPHGRSPGREGNLQQTKPAFVWWDIAPEAGPRATKIRVSERSQLPAPAWSILAEGWPGSLDRYKPAVVRAWADSAPPPAAYKVQIDLARLISGETAVVGTGEDGNVQVFASLENWNLRDDTEAENDFSTAESPPLMCLVVRILHPEGKPVFVRPTNTSFFKAEEHRYYAPSAAVTAVFGPTSRDLLEDKLQGQPLVLDLVSIAKFQAEHKPVTLKMPPAGPEQPRVASPKLPKTTENAP